MEKALVLIACMLGCDSLVIAPGAGGAPGEGGGSAPATNSAVGGSGGFDFTGGAGGALPECGLTVDGTYQNGVCPPGEECFHCESDDEGQGTIYSCRQTPAPLLENEFRCFYSACQLEAQFCFLEPVLVCHGDYEEQCLAIPPECANDPTCDCLAPLLCADNCSGTPATGVRLESLNGCVDP